MNAKSHRSWLEPEAALMEDLFLATLGLPPSPLHVTVWERYSLMATVFIPINSEVGTEDRVLATLQTLEVITETYIVIFAKKK